MVEQFAVNEKVAGSSPASGAMPFLLHLTSAISLFHA
jgi:hypothetical protein